MTIPFINRDLAFYPLVFGVWAVLIIVIHGNHSYFAMPLPAAEVRQDGQDDPALGRSPLDMGQAHRALAEEKKPAERARILEAMAIACFDRYRTQRAPTYLDSAQTYFEKALAIDSLLPVDNYMLAQIAQQKKNIPAAILHYDRELRTYAGPQSASSNLVADKANLKLAATLSALELAMLYSTASPNGQQARSYFNDYLKLETDAARRQTSIRDFQNHWPNNGPLAP